MAANDVKKIYQEIIADVCTTVREALQEEGYDDQTLKDLRTLWLEKLESSRALEALPISAVDQALNREFGRAASGETSSASAINNKQTGGSKVSRIHPTTNAAVTTYNSFIPTTSAVNPGMMSVTNQGAAQFIRPTFANPTNIGNSTMKTANQLDGAGDEVIRKKKKSKRTIEISFQVDGTGPPMGDDDDEDDESEVEGNDVGDDLDDDDDDEGNEEGREDPNPLCSDDDVSDDEPEKLFETENVIVCQYDKISRTKNKWRFILKSGVMNVEGRDYVFSKATGEADW